MTPDERLTTHEEKCEIRYREIERRLEQGEKRFDRLDNLMVGLYLLIISSILIPLFVAIQ
jgi:hypothetical protein